MFTVDMLNKIVSDPEFIPTEVGGSGSRGTETAFQQGVLADPLMPRH